MKKIKIWEVTEAGLTVTVEGELVTDAIDNAIIAIKPSTSLSEDEIKVRIHKVQFIKEIWVCES